MTHLTRVYEVGICLTSNAKEKLIMARDVETCLLM
jgi:hypothetical protein